MFPRDQHMEWGAYMPAEDRRKAGRPEFPHSVILEGRERLVVSGVVDVMSFDEVQIDVETTRGGLVIKGNGLHIESLSIDNGELHITGVIDSMAYETERRRGGGFFSRLMG